jgi:chitodextrinase
VNSNDGEGVKFQVRLVKTTEFDDKHYFLIKEAELTKAGEWQTLVFNTDDLADMAGKVMVPSMDSIDRIMLLPAAGYSKADSNLIYLKNLRIVDSRKSQGEMDTEKPSTPQNLTATADGKTVSLSWDAATDNVGVVLYKVYKQNGDVAGSTDGTNLNIGGLNYATTYEYQVTAIDDAGNESAKSTAVSVTTDDAPADDVAPSVPGGLTVNESVVGYLISWNASEDEFGVTGYKVYNGDEVIAEVAETSYTLSDYEEGTTYEIAVTAYDATGNESAKSETETFTTPGEQQNSIAANAKSLISIYPNPAANYLHVDANAPIARIEIMNLQGKSLVKTTIGEVNAVIAISDLEAGVYMIKITGTDNKVGIARFIKK